MKERKGDLCDSNNDRILFKVEIISAVFSLGV